ncbi:hypothetical protein BGZ98_003306, partial [Dissophora globulifera]
VQVSICVLRRGERAMAMLTPSSAKRQLDDPTVKAQSVRRYAKGADVNLAELKVAITLVISWRRTAMKQWDPLYTSLNILSKLARLKI